MSASPCYVVGTEFFVSPLSLATLFSMDTSAQSRDISEKAVLSRSRSPSRLSALVFIYINSLSDCSRRRFKVTVTHGCDGVTRRYKLMVVVIHQRLPLAVELSNFWTYTLDDSRKHTKERSAPVMNSFSRFSKAGNDDVVISCS